MIFQAELLPVFTEPFSAFFVFRHHGGNHVPEIFGMVHVGQVAELMDYHIIKDHRRREDQAVIKRQCSPGGAASPAGLLVPDGDGGVISARYPVKIGHPAFELLPGGIAVSFFQGFQTPDLGSGIFAVSCGNILSVNS